MFELLAGHCTFSALVTTYSLQFNLLVKCVILEVCIKTHVSNEWIFSVHVQGKKKSVSYDWLTFKNRKKQKSCLECLDEKN